MLSFEEAKKIIQSYPKKERWKIMGILYDNGLIEQREYSNEEIAKLIGISRTAVHKIFNSALEKLNNLKEFYYE